MKNYFTLLAILVIGFSANGQLLYSVNASANNVSNTNGEVNYSIGQVFVLSTNSSSAIIEEGIQHPPYQLSINIDEPSTTNGDFIIYPNPTLSDFTIENPKFHFVSIRVINSAGQTILSFDSSIGQNEISLANHSSGAYYIEVFDHNKKLFSTKLIKL